MIVNFNIGLLGHVDAGKTTLARVLSTVSSTAAFDKNPQSQERGITLDLGFSALLVDVPPQIRAATTAPIDQLQYTFVDCPGHASLIRTIIGGAQIIDLMLLVVDAQKGIQTQTAECIVIGELLQRQLIVVVNKTDLLEEPQRASHLLKLNAKLRKTLAKTSFGDKVPIFNVSAMHNWNINELLEGISRMAQLPQRTPDSSKPLLMYVDHCFAVRGQGTVCTGTIVQGSVAVNDAVEVTAIREQRKVKSIQMFHRAVPAAAMGDRVGLCLTQFNASQLERGVLAQPGYLQPMYAACAHLEQIQYYKSPIRSGSKIHITIGHDTVMGGITLFQAGRPADESTLFDLDKEYAFVEELAAARERGPEAGRCPRRTFVLIQFERPILARTDATLIAAKLDMDGQSNQCRLAFWGAIQWCTHSAHYATECLPRFKIYKEKLKEGSVQRLVNDAEAIVQHLCKKESVREVYVGKQVQLSTGELGVIEGTFGQAAKVKVAFRDGGLRAQTLDLLRTGRASEVRVLLKYKKYIFNKSAGLVQ